MRITFKTAEAAMVFRSMAESLRIQHVDADDDPATARLLAELGAQLAWLHRDATYPSTHRVVGEAMAEAVHEVLDACEDNAEPWTEGDPNFLQPGEITIDDERL